MLPFLFSATLINGLNTLGGNKMAEGGESFNKRFTELEDSIKEIKARLLAAGTGFAPVNNINVKAFFRDYLSFKIQLTVNYAIDCLRQRDEEIVPAKQETDVEFPPDPEQLKLREAASYLKSISETAIGELEHADDPLSVARKWYADGKSYLEKREIYNVLGSTPEKAFLGDK